MAYRSVILTAVLSACFTLAVSVASVISFAYRSPALHVAVETAAALISLLAAQLIFSRFWRSLELRDLALATSLCVFAFGNFAFSAIPAIAGEAGTPFATWAPVGSRLFAAALMAFAAFAPARSLRHPRRDVRRWLSGSTVVLAAVAAGAGLGAGILPEAIPPGLSPEGSARPRIVGNPVVLAVQLVVMLFFAAAAIGFTRRAQRTHDPLILWVAIGATLAAFARLNYFLFPSQYSEWFYTGDVLRLAFFLALLIGGLAEIRVTQKAVTAAAVLEERRRLARDLHDGMAQDMAYIVQHGRRMAERDGAPAGLRLLVQAAQSALDDSRHAFAALMRPVDESLAEALERTAMEAAGREDAEVEFDASMQVELPEETREALARVVREAINNAVRHGKARHIKVALSENGPLTLTVRDDGCGFDPDTAAQRPGHLGLTSMRQRVERVGGQFQVRSVPGEGSEVEVILP